MGYLHNDAQFIGLSRKVGDLETRVINADSEIRQLRASLDELIQTVKELSEKVDGMASQDPAQSSGQ